MKSGKGNMPSPEQPKSPRIAQPEAIHDRSAEAPGGSSPTDGKFSAGPLQTPRPPKRIAIVGTAPESVDLAPYDDPSWEIWTCSALALSARRFDRHFELHTYNEIARGWTSSAEHDAQMANQYLQHLAQLRPPQIVYMQEVDPRIPASRAYPIDSVFLLFPERYFASTVSYMIGLAILEGATEIGLWGVDMALSSEQYSGQRASAEWLLGYARGQGIKVTIPPEGDLLKIIEPYAYGSNSDGLKKIIAKKKFISERLRHAEAAKVAAEREIAGLSGALDGLDYVSRCWQADA